MFEIYEGKKILVTGHTGFKGSWLTHWLRKLGANVMGIAKNAPTYPSHFNLLGLRDMPNIRADLTDLRDSNSITTILQEFKPDLAFHLAAYAIVAKSFGDPRGTFEGNIMGTVNFLEACRRIDSLMGIVAITTDKVYKETEENKPFSETDELGGDDPYSASKVCVEHILRTYQLHYLPKIAIARAGNVIGGGDWSYKRLIPDAMKATAQNQPVEIHTPYATRPWQHVLDPLNGYLMLGEQILMGSTEVFSAWNFGPTGDMSVLQVMETAKAVWPRVQFIIHEKEHHPSMVRTLCLDSSKARRWLGWTPAFSMPEAIRYTVYWYRAFYEHKFVNTDVDLAFFGTNERSKA